MENRKDLSGKLDCAKIHMYLTEIIQDERIAFEISTEDKDGYKNIVYHEQGGRKFEISWESNFQ